MEPNKNMNPSDDQPHPSSPAHLPGQTVQPAGNGQGPQVNNSATEQSIPSAGPPPVVPPTTGYNTGFNSPPINETHTRKSKLRKVLLIVGISIISIVAALAAYGYYLFPDLQPTRFDNQQGVVIGVDFYENSRVIPVQEAGMQQINLQAGEKTLESLEGKQYLMAPLPRDDNFHISLTIDKGEKQQFANIAEMSEPCGSSYKSSLSATTGNEYQFCALALNPYNSKPILYFFQLEDDGILYGGTIGVEIDEDRTEDKNYLRYVAENSGKKWPASDVEEILRTIKVAD